ncbi:MAG TPA: beta-propeller fold lactonase family protein [Hyphomicrobiaceae bacterium]|nr:beta-propeller fold lactonase family protein [Hyphomicrobiaceae bacterium]
MRQSLKALTELSFATLLLCAITGAPALAKTFVYVSNAQDGNIDAYTMDKSTGALTSIGKTEAGKLVMPMVVSPNKKFLYAAVRSEPFRVITYAIDAKSGALTQKATAPLPDSMPYVSVDATSRFLFTASYGGDKIAVSPISPSGLVEAAAIEVIATGRNAHAILADRSNKFVYVPTLGANHVLQFLFDAKTGKLTPNEPASIDARPGDGPRHLVVSPNNKYVYVLNELTGNISQFAIDAKKGTLKEVASVASVPADSGLVPGKPQPPAGSAAAAAAKADDKPKVWAADLRLTPNGRFLYSTERTLSKIALFSVASGTGKLTYVTNFSTEKQPRGIRVDPTGTFLVASGEKSDRLAVYKIDQRNGQLTEVGRYPVGNGANWVEIIDVP